MELTDEHISEAWDVADAAKRRWKWFALEDLREAALLGLYYAWRDNAPRNPNEDFIAYSRRVMWVCCRDLVNESFSERLASRAEPWAEWHEFSLDAPLQLRDGESWNPYERYGAEPSAEDYVVAMETVASMTQEAYGEPDPHPLEGFAGHLRGGREKFRLCLRCQHRAQLHGRSGRCLGACDCVNPTLAK